MGVFKNEVGRPSNETIKKRNILKVICFILVVIILLLVAYIVNDKLGINGNNGNKNRTTTRKDEVKEETISNEEAKNILKRVFGYKPFYPADELNNELRMALLFQNVNDSRYNIIEYKETKDTCVDLFGEENLSDGISDGIGENTVMYRLKFVNTNDNNLRVHNFYCDNHDMDVYDGLRKVYEYDDVNKTYKNFFGNKLNAPKSSYYTDIYESSSILYSSIKNVYTNGHIIPGNDHYDINIYNIPYAVKKGNEVIIKVNYSELKYKTHENNEDIYIVEYNDGSSEDVLYKYGEEIIVGENSYNTSGFIDELSDKKFLGKLKNTITYKFFLEDGVWKLKDIVSNN